MVDAHGRRVAPGCPSDGVVVPARQRAAARRWAAGVLLVAACLVTAGCGGGNGLGPTAVRKQEDAAWERLALSRAAYNAGDYDGAREGFTAALSQADRLEGTDGTRNRVKSEAYNGIGWTAFRQQDVDLAQEAYQQSVALDRQNADAWVGWGGLALALRQHTNAVQFAISALDADLDYNSALRHDGAGTSLAHDAVDTRHVRLVLAEAYFQLGFYSPGERSDPYNAAAQVRLLRASFQFIDPGQLLTTMGQVATELQAGGAL